jgi:hypothetical protein
MVFANAYQTRGARPAYRRGGANASVALREQLLADLAGLGMGEDLDRWAHNCLPAKKTLTPDDARRVEEAFQAKLSAVGAAEAYISEAAPAPNGVAFP